MKLLRVVNLLRWYLLTFCYILNIVNKLMQDCFYLLFMDNG